MTQPQQIVTKFPFTLEDLHAVVLIKQSGDTTKLMFDALDVPIGKSPGMAGFYQGNTALQTTHAPYVPKKSLGEHCKHDPSDAPLFEGSDFDLWIADAGGARAHKDEFDVVIDGGSVFASFEPPPPPIVLRGDKKFIGEMGKFVAHPPERTPARIFSINWADRGAPTLQPKFWPALVKFLVSEKVKTVLTCCQGGHGRSGTSAVALMMCLSDYTPLQAITHLRAVHCPRAIESVVQHEYLNKLAKLLGRAEDALEAEKVTDFRKAFLEMDLATAKPYQDRLREAKLTEDTVSKEDTTWPQAY